jgi:N-succinyldiaminopimelate aminotransferase
MAKRDLLCDGLEKVGFTVHRPAGTYFATVDVRSLGFDDGVTFCRVVPERCGVVAVPSSAFYADGAGGRHLVRFTFCKRDEVLSEAVSRLAGLA